MRTRCAARRWLLPLLFLLALPAVVQAQYTCTTNNGTITITGYTGAGGVVTIPGIINGYPVTGIGTNAFLTNSSLTGVTITNSVTNIADFAFYRCTGLTNITVPGSVASIGDRAFSRCTSLIVIA
jgi:hypothetical protein